MGGCSSKPKTTEFEGSMDLQEDKPQDELARKSLDPEKKGVDAGLKSIDREQKGSSEHSLQTLFVENKRGDLREVLLESEKQPIAGFNPEDNGKKAEEKPVIAEREIPIEGESLKLQKEPVVPAAETLELQKESVVAKEETVEPQEEPLVVVVEAETTKTKKEPVIESEETLEIQKEPVLPGVETLEVQKALTVAEEEASELQKEPIVAGEKTGEETLELQKESIVAVEGTAELQEEAPGEVKKESEQSQFQETISEDKGAELDAGPGYGEEGKQGEKESKEGELLGDGKETVACKVDSATDDGTVVQVAEREEEVFEKANEPVKEEEKAQSEVIDEATEGQSALITSRSLGDGDTTTESLTTSSNPPSEVKQNDTSCVVTPTMTANESPRDVEPVVGESPPISTPTTTVPDCPVEDQMQVQEADKAASEFPPEPESSAEQHAEPTAEPGEKIVAPEPVSSTSDQVKARQDSEVSEGLVIDHEDHPATSQPSESMEVTATPEKSSPPEVQSVHVTEGNEPAEPVSSKNISAREIAAPDIDEVLEKLASEFERQESLSSSMH